MARTGFYVWMDQEEISTGTNWQLQIGNAIEKSVGMICVIDRKYVGSVFCCNELNMAQNKALFLFPVLFRKFEFGDLPNDLQYVLSSTNCMSFPGSSKRPDDAVIDELIVSVKGVDPTNVHIVVVDDEQLNLMLLEAILKREGYKVTKIADGEAVLQSIRHVHKEGALPDVLLLDLQMPKITGFDVLKSLRKKYSKEELPVIMMSATSEPVELTQGLSAELNDFM